MIQHDLAPVAADAWQTTDQLFRAIAAYLTRFTGASRDHACSDLRVFLSWCAERHLHRLTARRPHLELYIALADQAGDGLARPMLPLPMMVTFVMEMLPSGEVSCRYN